ncbi:MAG TPA: alpha-glucan family phosphorylase [Planctomycetota bacterium]|nr:alpha-glucan family phosphorylase [Planctomycetota bacterium]
MTRSSTISSIRQGLESLSRNLWWSWDQDALLLWRRVADALPPRSAPPARRKALERNPVELLRALGKDELRKLADDPELTSLHQRVMAAFRAAIAGSAPPASLSAARPVAYFSMEFGIHESLPIYAGGLGILAGDHAKSSSDESVPLTGVGLFYHNGYFRQELDAAGRQKVIYPKADLGHLPMEALRSASGKEVRVVVELPAGNVQLKVWRVQVGRVDLLLLDSDIPENRKADRTITHRLYGGTREDRIRQEVVAGIGGVRALRAAGINPGVWHLNEGHVAFLTLERLREVRGSLRLSVAEALEVIAAGTVFTTHTPVPEGNETFDLALAERYLAPYTAAAGMPIDEYLSLGLDHGPDGKPCLSMTVLAIRLSRHRNGVSSLHGEVSRKMWSRLWPGFAAGDAPITSVTNGVHTLTWVSRPMDALLRSAAGKDWMSWLDDEAFWKRTSRLSERELWEVKEGRKKEMVAFVRERERERLERSGMDRGKSRAAAEKLLDPGVFTIGFARRFAIYKRSALLFRNMERARKLFASRTRPVQIIFSGKPHPEDAAGRAVFEHLAAIARRKELQGRVVLLENYDIEVCRYLVQGVDLWLNNPRRPLEASGTSGQKVPVNAGLNLSILDGWWAEGYEPRAGWAFGETREYDDPEEQDRKDSEALYRVLEDEVLPLYYRRDRSGVPVEWFRKVKSSMASLIPRFSTSRMVLEYARRLYSPALEAGIKMRAAGARMARDLVAWKSRVCLAWPLVHVRGATEGKRGTLIVDVFLGAIPPGDIRCLEDGRDGAAGVERAVNGFELLEQGYCRLEIEGAGRGTAKRPRTLRLFPAHPHLIHPVELGLAIEIVL